jgi:hypothetical protein
LSEEGRQRRRQILRLAVKAAGGRRARRRLGMAALLAIFMIGPALLVEHFRAAVVPPPPSPIVAESKSPPPSDVSDAVVVTWIKADPHALDGILVGPGPKRWETIGDDELLGLLSSGDHPAGLANVDGVAMLVMAGAETMSGGN